MPSFLIKTTHAAERNTIQLYFHGVCVFIGSGEPCVINVSDEDDSADANEAISASQCVIGSTDSAPDPPLVSTSADPPRVLVAPKPLEGMSWSTVFYSLFAGLVWCCIEKIHRY